MPRLLFPALAAILPIAVSQPGTAHPMVDLKAYCKQLVAFYDRYGASRSENSDGRRNHARIAAGIDCKDDDGQEAGIEVMTDLLERKRFRVPAPSRSVDASTAGE